MITNDFDAKPDSEIQVIEPTDSEEVTKMQQQLRSTQNDLECEAQRAQRYRKERSRLRQENANLTEHYRVLREAFQQREETLKRAQEKEEALVAQNRELAFWKNKCSELEFRLGNTGSLLQRRTAELTEAQTFLGVVDEWSDGDIIRMVEHLNSETFQLAASISDQLEWKACRDVDETNALRGEKKELEKDIGARLIHILQMSPTMEDPLMYVQLGLQAVMLRSVSAVVSGWGDCERSAINTALYRIYQNLYNNESQSVSGRWRNLTRRYIQNHSDPEHETHTYCNKLYNHIHDVLAMSQCINVHHTLHSESVMSKIGEIVKLSVELRKAIGEGMISSDFEPILPRPGDTFDLASMEDANSGERGRNVVRNRSPTSMVLCPTGLGLRREERRRAEGKAVATVSVAIKSQVVLETFLDDLENEKNHAINENSTCKRERERQTEDMDTSL
ncbi:hypothetical protein C8Q75DRAFT_785481 [Abortiporus biennis]|nr:hypothetical protein C8Q75DRAFT_785481 [Abortiporus biennis]